MRQSDAPIVLLIDGYSLLHRAYYALPTLTARDGTPTHAVYGFALMLLRLMEDVRPEYIAIAFDSPSPTFRHKAFTQYKAHRPSMPDDLRRQIPIARELIEAMNIPIIEIEGYEGDDIVGTLAKKAEGAKIDALIVTGDKDALQLVGRSVRVALTKRGIREVETYDAGRVQEEMGVPPQRVADLKGLVGDKSDNIPGVPGIGLKTAARLLSEYGSLEEALKRAGEIAGKVGTALKEHRDAALLSKALATIDQDAPVAVDWDALRRKEPHIERLADLYRRLEFRTLLKGIESSTKTSEHIKNDRPVRILRDGKAIQESLGSLPQGVELVVYPVWSGSRPLDGTLVGVGVATAEASYYIPVDSLVKDEPRAAKSVMTGPLGDVLQKGLIVCHDAKALLLLLEESGPHALKIIDDVMIQGYLCAPGQGGYSLDDLALRYDVPGHPQSETASEGLANKSVDETARFVAVHLATIKELRQSLSDRLEQDGLGRLYEEIELPLAGVLAEMERTGIRVDVQILRDLASEFGDQIKALEESIFARAGVEFNLNSPKQLAEVLFERLGLPVLRKTKTGPSTSAEVLESLGAEHEIVSEILEYRQLQKLKSTYADALPKLVHPKTGRVHTSFNQAVAATGRLSSANPNLQNIPVRTEAGRRIRRAFVPRVGYTLVKADYSQIELRVLAHIAQDEALIEAFQKGADIHSETASDIFGIPPADVTREQREAAKAINFGIVYGISSFGLARDTGLSQDEAKRFIDRYLERYPQVARYMEESVERARELSYVVTLFGRRRYLPDITSRKWNVRKMAERTAINTPIQGSAADIIKAAMVAVHRRLKEEEAPAAILLQVHDELVLECEEGHTTQIARLVKEEMEGVVRLDAPLRAEIAVGPNWLDVRPAL